MTQSRKGIYYDGHEREDVVEVCFAVASISYLEILLQDRLNRFIPEMMEMLENCVTVERNSDDNIVVIRPEAKYILVNQDEKIHHSNDVQNR